jgi:hypothetical protein
MSFHDDSYYVYKIAWMLLIMSYLACTFARMCSEYTDLLVC